MTKVTVISVQGQSKYRQNIYQKFEMLLYEQYENIKTGSLVKQ